MPDDSQHSAPDLIAAVGMGNSSPRRQAGRLAESAIVQDRQVGSSVRTAVRLESQMPRTHWALESGM